MNNDPLLQEIKTLSDRVSTLEMLIAQERLWRRRDRHRSERITTLFLLCGMAISVFLGTGLSYSRSDGFGWKLPGETLTIVFGAGSLLQVGFSLWADKQESKES